MVCGRVSCFGAVLEQEVEEEGSVDGAWATAGLDWQAEVQGRRIPSGRRPFARVRARGGCELVRARVRAVAR